MEIKNSEWTAFAEFVTWQSTHFCTPYCDSEIYTCCPFSTMERAYAAFSVWRTCHSESEVKKFWDVDVEAFNPELTYHDVEEQYDESLQEQEEIEYAFKEAAGFTYFGIEDWEPEWDNYCIDREKQIARIAHELADKYENLHIFGDKSWVSLVYPFYEKYELNSDERYLFTQEYYSQHYFRYGYV